MISSPAALLSLTLVTSGLVAATWPQPRVVGCGTGTVTDTKARLLHQLAVRTREGTRSMAAEAAVRVEDGTLVMRTGPGLTLGDHPLDLHNSSIVLTPVGNEGYRVSKIPLQYDQDRGPLVRRFRNPTVREHYYIYELQNFSFPLSGQEHRRLYLTAFNGISFSPPEVPFGVEQFDALEIASQPEAIISPLLLSANTPPELPYPDLHVREGGDGLVVTWRTSASEKFGYDIQAVLGRTGEIVFSYGEIRSVDWGVPVVNPGAAAWQVPATIKQETDVPGDTTTVTPEAFRKRVDLLSATLLRMNDSDLLQLRIQTAAPITIDGLSEDDALLYLIVFFDLASDDFGFAAVLLLPDGTTLFLLDRVMIDSTAVRIEGDTLVVNLLQESLGLRSPETGLGILSGLASAEDPADLLTTFVELTPPQHQITSDLSAPMQETRRAVFEAFTLPSLDLFSVWDELERSFRLSPSSVDAIAVYQTFFTDIVFYASAYALPGNPQADGVADRSAYGTLEPRAPALMHMNKLDFGLNENAKDSGSISLHEFGHRWLYGVAIRENGLDTRVLAPLTDHPAQYVHTPAAFAVHSASDASVMGGGFFRDNADGTFTSGEFSAYGYSWTDLYLMGLASPQEVSSWFYVHDSNPPLGEEYFPPPGRTVRGVRRDVVMQQVVDAMGVRNPTSDVSQKNFRVYFVLLARPGEEPSAEQLAMIREHRRVLETTFRAATGDRGTVTTTFIPPQRVRAVRH